jgi:hypothetical protein
VLGAGGGGSLLVFLFCLCGVVAARGQSVRWEPAESGLANAIMLVFENCEPDGQPVLPTIPGVSFTSTGRSTSMNIVNFQMTRTVALSYTVRGPQNPPVQIPAFTVKTDKGPLPVPPFRVAAPAAPLESVANAKLIPSRPSVWAGEVFGLNYELSAARRANPQVSPTFDWNAAPLVAEDWSKPEVSETVVAGDRRVNVVFRTRAMAPAANTLKLEAATHLLSIQTGTIGFGIISQPRMEQVSVTSDQPTLEVKPLPAGAPAAFHGAVGQFKLVSKVVPEKAAVGEPVTWTLELGGTGNWPAIDGLPSRRVSNDFQVVQPKAKRTPADGKLFDVTLAEDVVLVPTKAGTYTLGPVTFAFFEPQSGSYKTITAPAQTVTISAAPAPQFNVMPQPAATPPPPEPGPAATPPPPATRKPPTSPTPPAGIPRDPLPGRATAPVPMSARSLGWFLLAPGASLGAFWIFLALRRAAQTDPLRPQREARDRLAKTLAALPTASDRDRSRLLLAWQHDSAALWQIAHAAPPAQAIQQAGSLATRSTTPRLAAAAAANASDWAALWHEADRTLYSAKAALPSDWLPRAEAALAAKRVPGFQPFRLFLPRNLLPFAALLAISFGSATAWLHAASQQGGASGGADSAGAAAYRKGDFPAAEKAWRAALGPAPTDWIARHNLSLALAQQDRAGEAAAQAAAAFVQRPTDPAVRWHFANVAEKAGTVPAPLAGFFNPGPRHALAQLASPAGWQFVLIAAAWGVAFALGLLLARSYGYLRRLPAAAPLAILIASLLVAAAATTGFLTYGLAARSEAVITTRNATLHSIPTEADTAQKKTPLAAGSLAAVDKTFLGWRRLAFDHGQTGWVRQDDLVPLWK